MQEETKRAIDTMQAGTAQIQRGVEQTSQAGASQQEIIAAAEKVGDMAAQIASAATEQAATTPGSQLQRRTDRQNHQRILLRGAAVGARHVADSLVRDERNTIN